MQTIKFSQNWNNKLLLDSYFTTIRIFSNANHVVGTLVDCELMRKGEPLNFVAEIASVTLCLLDRIPEFVFMIDTGYTKENAIKMFENMYKNKNIDVHQVQFCILTLKHRPDLEQRVLEANQQKALHEAIVDR